MGWGGVVTAAEHGAEAERRRIAELVDRKVRALVPVGSMRCELPRGKVPREVAVLALVGCKQRVLEFPHHQGPHGEPARPPRHGGAGREPSSDPSYECHDDVTSAIVNAPRGDPFVPGF